MAGWEALHPEADWNEFSPDEVETFQGVVRSNPKPPAVGFLQRHNRFCLETGSGGRIDIYGGSAKLESFLGSSVELEGKRVVMALEGKIIKEIWPVRIRPTS